MGMRGREVGAGRGNQYYLLIKLWSTYVAFLQRRMRRRHRRKPPTVCTFSLATRSPETARRPGGVLAAPGKEWSSMKSATGVEPAGLRHWTTSAEREMIAHTAVIRQRPDQGVAAVGFPKFVFANCEVGK